MRLDQGLACSFCEQNTKWALYQMASSQRGEFSPAKYAVDLFGDSTNNRERESEIRQKDNGILVR